jgi:hypothetical protein
VCGPAIRAAAGQDAELVALWVGKDNPALLAGLADVGVPGTKAEQAADLFILPRAGRAEVQVEPVLAGLALGHAGECQRRRHGAAMVVAVSHPRGANRDGFVVFVLHLVVEGRAPEPGETAGIGTVDREFGEPTGHARTSRSTSGSANGHTPIGIDRRGRVCGARMVASPAQAGPAARQRRASILDGRRREGELGGLRAAKGTLNLTVAGVAD